MTKGEQKAFWKAADRAAKNIAKWPKWKRKAAEQILKVSTK